MIHFGYWDDYCQDSLLDFHVCSWFADVSSVPMEVILISTWLFPTVLRFSGESRVVENAVNCCIDLLRTFVFDDRDGIAYITSTVLVVSLILKFFGAWITISARNPCRGEFIGVLSECLTWNNSDLFCKHAAQCLLSASDQTKASLGYRIGWKQYLLSLKKLRHCLVFRRFLFCSPQFLCKLIDHLV